MWGNGITASFEYKAASTASKRYKSQIDVGVGYGNLMNYGRHIDELGMAYQ